MIEAATDRIVTDVFDMNTPFGRIASTFFADRIEDWHAGRLRFPEVLEPDQYEDWLLGQAVLVGCHATRYAERIAGANHG